MNTLKTIPLDAIVPNPEQPRDRIDEDELKSLAESIQEKGLLNPIAVEDAGGDTYILIDGERRWRACALIGMKEIPANVLPGKNGNGQKERLIQAMVANLQRSDMNPIEEGKAFSRLQEQGMRNVDIAKLLGCSNSHIASRIKMTTNLAPEVQELYTQRRLPLDETVFGALYKLQPEIQVKVALHAAMRGMIASRIAALATRFGNEAKREKVIITHHKQPLLGGSSGEEWSVFRIVENRIPHNKLLTWEHLVKGAGLICKHCAIFDVASEKNCSECPLVEFMKAVQE